MPAVYPFGRDRKSNPLTVQKDRKLIAIYSAKQEETETAYRAVRELRRGPATLYAQDGSVRAPSRSADPFAEFRFEGEGLIVAISPPENVPAMVSALGKAGTPAIFVLQDDTAEGPLPGGAGAGPPKQSILARLKSQQRTFESARHDLLEASRLNHPLTTAAEWIIDNPYLVRTQANEVRRHLPRDYYRVLRARAQSAEDPKALQLAKDLAARTDFAIDKGNLLEFLRDCQKERPLTVGELWLFPLLLRAALIEGLAGLAQQVSRSQRLRELAFLWANRLAAAARLDPALFERMMSLLAQEPRAREQQFAISLAEQLQDEEDALGPVQRWIEKQFEASVSDLLRREHTRETAERLATANAFGSLRALGRIDFSDIFEAVSVVEAELRKDPAGSYPLSDFTTRDRCRRAVERIASRCRQEEPQVALRAIQLAQEQRARNPEAIEAHVAYYLLAEGVERLEACVDASVPVKLRLARAVSRHAMLFYAGGILAVTACLLGLACRFAVETGVHQRALLAILAGLAILPLSELSTQIINALVMALFPPEPLPKMDFKAAIPKEDATLVTVPMMLSSREAAREEVEKLEVRFLANQDQYIQFSLFSDFTDATERSTPKDAELLDALRSGIENLNSRYPGEHFVLFHRDRTWSESEQLWIGQERKRGKIEALNLYLSGEAPEAGEKPERLILTGRILNPVRYVITLDSDTQLPPGAANRLIAAAAHPLNRPVLDPVTHTRRRGYTVIQPRVSIALPGAIASRFTRIFAETAGTDPYCKAVSDAHQDLFGEATFHGKAIYEVKSFREALADRFPAETILSHDLIEGAHAGAGLATDIELFENLPLEYSGYSRREHRWIRGDWQIAAWVLPRVPAAHGGWTPNPLNAINRWRIFDNLRRSLAPVSSVLLLLFAWLTDAAPATWTWLVGLAAVIPTLAPLMDRLARKVQGTALRWRGSEAALVRAVVAIAFLPHQAWIAADAIVRALYRVNVSRRKMLEWQPAGGSGASLHAHRHSTYFRMLLIASISAVLLAYFYIKGAFSPPATFLCLWIIAPALMRWLAHPEVPTARRNLNRTDKAYLRVLARRTWRYFDDLVGPRSNWLPPDNSQLALRVEVAQRTSPTNIGLWLSSALAATDLGYLTADQFVERCEKTVATIQKLETCEGHLLNWYETETLKPLSPRYVSTVDSGNLLACFWVLSQGCREIVHRPVVGRACLRGLQDTVAILRQTQASDPSMEGPLLELRHLVHKPVRIHLMVNRLMSSVPIVERVRESARWHPSPDEKAYWAERAAAELESWRGSAQRYLRWMRTLTEPPDSFLRGAGPDAATLRRRAIHVAPSLQEMADGGSPALRTIAGWKGSSKLPAEVSAWLDQLCAEIQEASLAAAETLQRFAKLAEACERLARGINMRFLYDEDRRLFTVGYTVGGPVQFTSHYDLLASECRLASLVAIAKGDVPVQHWFSMSRPRALLGGHQILLSWSGTMFEYLMPLIFMRTYDNSLLDLACREAVRQQIAYGDANQVPWGCSESAFSALDANRIYQYRAFGVPALALKSGLEEDMVVAPYATMMALLVEPLKAIKNLRRLEDFGLAGPMGLYESIDFARENKENGRPGLPVYAYMAHHQGMSLAALDDVLHRGIMRYRFHSDLRVRAVESLLFEGIPITKPPAEDVHAPVAPLRLRPSEEQADRTWKKEDAGFPRIHLQGNGRYALMLTNGGGGYSQWNGFDLTRWRADPAIDQGGAYLYLKDLGTQTVWSAAQSPISDRNESLVRFSADRAEFQRNVAGLDSVLAVTVAEDDAEVRRLTITNQSKRTRRLEITSYVELAMAPHAWDSAHPAFAKMFVQTERPGEDVLVAWRRLREPAEAPIWVAHLVADANGKIAFETDRAKFLGRGNTPGRPDALSAGLSGTCGTVLDPIFSLSCQMELSPRERKSLTFVTLAASSREELLALVDKYRRPETRARAFEFSWTRSQLAFRYLGTGPAAAHRFHELAGMLLFPSPRLRPPPDRLAQNRLGQAALWAYGISGDLPILAVAIADARNLPLVREVLLAHTFWRLRGFKADVVILNQEGGSYGRPLQEKLQHLIDAHSTETGVDRPGGVFLRDWDGMPEPNRQLILAAAAAVLAGSRGSLAQQLAGAQQLASAPSHRALPPPFSPSGGREEPSPPLPFLELPYFNGLGGFSQDGREYAIYLHSPRFTPAPWANVLANPGFGSIVTESGLGCTWNGNSQSNRLTPWHNDPVSDPQSEIIYIRDEETGSLWTPTALPIHEDDPYRARHGQGYTVFEHNSHAIEQELTVTVPAGADRSGSKSLNNDPVKLYRLRLRNAGSRARRLTVTFYAEWVLGPSRERQMLHVNPGYDPESGALMASQTWSGDYAGAVAFAASGPRATSYSADRVQFLGRNGSFTRPAALTRKALDNRVLAGLDPCAALQMNVTLDSGKSQDLIFVLGEASNLDRMRELVRRYASADAFDTALRNTREWWDHTLGGLQVRTPLLSADMLLNRWLQYQALGCRMWARSAVYQSSGAFGFRDQLQDSMAVVYAAPDLTRQHILLAAARQFSAGDVQHWWHAETGTGVRTRCSDDLVWLPYVVAHYIRVTGDDAILDQPVPFLEGPELEAKETERMFTPAVSAFSAPLWEHCSRALERAWRLGPHGLPLIGNGDWNDGLNRVGIEGRGESVWLGWFLAATMEAFHDATANAADGRRIPEPLRQTWTERIAQLASALSSWAWDGEWYLRGFFDNGALLGSRGNEEAKIDSIAQSWAVLSGAADAHRAGVAMEAAEKLLVDEKNRLVKLFTPPFDTSQPHPGYIMGYPPGLRENGGQYTHGSLWMAAAWARLGQGDRAVSLLTLMNPVEHSRNIEAASLYKGEPYISPADVYTAPGHVGRSGWTWYTGSAAWMYRIWIEEVLGFHLSGSTLRIQPVLPESWPGFEIRYRYGTAVYEIEVRRMDAAASTDTRGRIAAGGIIPLHDDGAIHKLVVLAPCPSGKIAESTEAESPALGRLLPA